MKIKISVISSIIISVLIILLFTGCAEKVSIQDRLDMFIAELNKTDRSDVYTNCHPDASKYSQAKPASYWDGIFPTAQIEYSLDSTSPSGSTVLTTLKSTGGLNDSDIEFEMKEDTPDVWFINKIDLNDDDSYEFD